MHNSTCFSICQLLFSKIFIFYFVINSCPNFSNKKAPTYQSRPLCFFYSTIIKRWLPSFDFHSHCSTNRFVCNFLSSSVGFNPCNCFFPTHLCLLLSLPTFSRPSIPRFSSLPFYFLTSAVSAFFRPLQFWILTTQPLFFLSFSS